MNIHETKQKAELIKKWFDEIIPQCQLGNCPADIGAMDMIDILETFEAYERLINDYQSLLKDYQNKFAEMGKRQK